MKLYVPFGISPSLLPGLKIDNNWIESLSLSEFRILFESGNEYNIEGFRPAPNSNLQKCFAAILGFLSAWNESLNYGPNSDNYNLFDSNNEELVNFVNQYTDELTIMEIEIEESEKQLIIE